MHELLLGQYSPKWSAKQRDVDFEPTKKWLVSAKEKVYSKSWVEIKQSLMLPLDQYSPLLGSQRIWCKGEIATKKKVSVRYTFSWLILPVARVPTYMMQEWSILQNKKVSVWFAPPWSILPIARVPTYMIQGWGNLQNKG